MKPQQTVKTHIPSKLKRLFSSPQAVCWCFILVALSGSAGFFLFFFYFLFFFWQCASQNMLLGSSLATEFPFVCIKKELHLFIRSGPWSKGWVRSAAEVIFFNFISMFTCCCIFWVREDSQTVPRSWYFPVLSLVWDWHSPLIIVSLNNLLDSSRGQFGVHGLYHIRVHLYY